MVMPRAGEYIAPDTKIMALRKRAGESRLLEKNHEQETDIRLITKYKETKCEFERNDTMEELIHYYFDVICFAYNNPGKRPGQQIAKNLSFSFSSEDKEDLFSCALTCFIEMIEEYEAEMGPFENFVRATLRHRVFNEFFEVEIAEQLHTRALKDHEDFVYELKSIFLEEEDQITDDDMRLYEALNTLTKQQKEVFMLLVVNEWNSTEVSEELGISAAHARKVKQVTAEKLKRYLTK